MADQGSRLQNLDFLPENLNLALLDFQRHGVRFGINNKGRCLIGDEMGLGKTLQAISIAYYYKDEWPLLIVVPSSMKYPWIEEIEKWITDCEPGDINLIRSGTDISNIPTSKVSILGYGLCGDRRSSKLLVNAMKKQQFKVVILDESHYLKNRTAGRTKLLHPIAQSAKRVILLTGTPSLARPEELYIQLDIVRPGAFGTFSAFANRYCEAHYEDVGRKFRKWNTRGACRLDELHSRLRNGMMIRRLKKNVLTQLPPKRRQKITFDLPESEHKKELFQFKAEFKQHHHTVEDKQSSPLKKREAIFELNRLSTVLYHYTGLAKAGSIQHYISDLLDGMENKFIVFCRHRQVIMAVIQQLSKKHVKYIHIDGSVPASVRGALVNQFQNDPSVRVAVLAIEAASFGLTLTAADHVVFAELHYTPGVMMQAEDRAHRIGQANAVNVHYLVGRGTLDEVLWGMLRKKIYVTSSALDGKLDELHADEGDEEKSKQLSACAAWLRDECEDDEEELQGYLFSLQPKKSRHRTEGQKDVRTYFTPPTSSSKPAEISLLDSDEDEEMPDAPSPSSTRIDCKENTTIPIVDSSEDGDEYDEDELANMLVEESDGSNGSESSSSKPKAQDISAGLTNGRNSNERKNVKHITETNSTGRDASARLYEDSEMVDSEDIFQSYIDENDDDDDDGGGGGGGGDGDDDMKAQVQSKSVSSSSSPKENSLSCPEKLENADNRLTVSRKCEQIHGSSNTRNPSQHGDVELEKTRAESLERARKRNPFSLKHKGKVDKILPLKMIDSDSDDDFVNPTPPKSSLERKDEAVACTSSQERKDMSHSDSRTQDNKKMPLSTISTMDTQDNKKMPLSTISTRDIPDSKKSSLSNISTTDIQEKKKMPLSTISTRDIQDNKETSLCGSSTTSAQDYMETFISTLTTNSFNIKQNAPKRKKKASPKARTPWSCRACTLINDPQMIECSMCFTAKQPENPVVNGEESIAVSADLTDSGLKLDATHVDDKTSDYFSGSPTNTDASEDTQPSSSHCVSCKNDGILTNVYQQSTETVRVENERNNHKTKRPYSCKSSPPFSLSDDDDLDDFTKKSSSQWSCSACTFLNDAMLNECCICMTPRRRSQRKTKSRWSTWSCEKRRQEGQEKSYKKKFYRKETEGGHEYKGEISEIVTNIDGKLIDTQEAAPENMTKAGETRTRKKLIMGEQDERALVNDEKTLSVEKDQLCTIPEDAEGKDETSFRQNGAKEQGQVCAREDSEEEQEEMEEDPFILEYSDSDAAEDNASIHDKEIATGRNTVEQDTSRLTKEKSLVRLEETKDGSDEGIIDGRQGSNCKNGLAIRSLEEENSADMTRGDGGNHEDGHDGKERYSWENELPQPQEECKLTQMVGQQTTRERGQDDEDSHDGRERSSWENELPQPQEECKLTQIMGQQTTRERGQDDEGSHDGRERSSWENELPQPQEECKLTQIMGQQTTRERGQDDEGSHDGRERSSWENELPQPQEECKLTQIMGQQTTRERGQDDEGSHDRRERSSWENDLCKPQEDGESPNSAKHQTPKSQENIIDDDEDVASERNSSSHYNSAWQTNSPDESNLTKENELDENKVTSEEDRKIEQQRKEGERITSEGHEHTNSKSNTKKPGVEESLQELQEAAEQIFGCDDDFEDLSMGNDVTVDSNETKLSDVVIRKPKDPPEPIALQFSLSIYTDRVYLYDENDQYLQSSFTMSDVKNNNREDLPHVLQHDYNYKQAKRVIREWDRLGVQQKRILAKSKLVFLNPFEAYRMARAIRSEKSPTNVRHPSKELRLQKVMNAALEVGGQVRLVTRTPASKKRKRPPMENEGVTSDVRNPAEETSSASSKDFSCLQAFGPDGLPLCLFCKAPVDHGTLGNEWDSRFCNHDCKENYQIRISGTAVRRTLFEAEQGVCQLCHFDAHACFQAVKSLAKKERRAFLEKSIYSDLPPQLLNRMIVDPKEGMFWEADHIVAVVEGGGECGMENFRTLCVPCHKKVTRELLQRLRTKRQKLDITGSQKIATFLKSKS